MLVSGQRGRNNKFSKKYDPKNGLKMAKMQWNKILTQRSMGCLGQVTKVFGHFLSYFFVKKIPLSRRVGYVVDGSMGQ